jgi:hypothetical protein
MHISNLRKRTAVSAAIALLVAAIAVPTVLARGGREKRMSDVHAAIAAAAAAVGTNQIASGSLSGGTLSLVMKPGSGTNTRALWEAKVVGRVVAEAAGGAVGQLAFREAGANTNVNGGNDPIRPLQTVGRLNAEGCRGGLSAAADAAGALLVAVRTIDVLNGGCVITLRPRGDEAAFLEDAGARIGSVLGAIPDIQLRPYFVTVVNRSNAPQLQVGWVPGIGGDFGQGIGWEAPGVQSSAILAGSHH